MSHRRRVFLDPDGTWPKGWVFVVVRAPTGVIYEQQCAGVATELREVEGYLVPLGGLKVDPEAGRVDALELTAAFHRGRRCTCGMGDSTLSPSQQDRLRAAVATIPYWTTTTDDADAKRSSLALDEALLNEATEAWAPVITPDGPGILLWENCD